MRKLNLQNWDILRDFEIDGLENKKLLFQKAAETIEKRYGKGRVKLTGIHEYSNPKAEIEKHLSLSKLA